MKKILLIFFCVWTSCHSSSNKSMVSPSKLFHVETAVNQGNRDERKKDCIILRLYDANGKLLDTVQTGASNYAKWFAGWYPSRDTVLLRSSDIGTSAYKIAKDKLLRIDIDPNIKSYVDRVFATMYN